MSTGKSSSAQSCEQSTDKSSSSPTGGLQDPNYYHSSATFIATALATSHGPPNQPVSNTLSSMATPG